MPFDLHPKARAALRQRMAEGFGKWQVSDGKFLEYATVWLMKGIDDALPANIRTQAEAWVSHEPLFMFTHQVVQERLSDEVDYQKDLTRLLVEVPGFEDPEALAEGILEAFTQLPRRYTYTVPLPEHFPDLLAGKPATELSPDLRLVRFDDKLRDQFRLTTGVKHRDDRIAPGLFGFLVDPFKDGVLALQLTLIGFVGPYGPSPSLTRAHSHVRSFLGLLMGTGFFDGRRTSTGLPSVAHAYVHLAGEAGWTVHRREDIDRAMSEALHMFGVEAWFDAFTAVADDDQRHGVIATLVDQIRPGLGGSSEALRLQLAAKWYFDGVHAEALQAFVNTMVCLEILVGENKADESIGGSIRSRCAYLLAGTHAERASIDATLADAYVIRGKIVHTGKDTLSPKEEVRLVELRAIVMRVVRKELELLKAALPKPGPKPIPAAIPLAAK